MRRPVIPNAVRDLCEAMSACDSLGTHCKAHAEHAMYRSLASLGMTNGGAQGFLTFQCLATLRLGGRRCAALSSRTQ